MHPGDMFLMAKESASNAMPQMISISMMADAAIVIRPGISSKTTPANLALQTASLATLKHHAKYAMRKKITSFPTTSARNAIYRAAWTVRV